MFHRTSKNIVRFVSCIVVHVGSVSGPVRSACGGGPPGVAAVF